MFSLALGLFAVYVTTDANRQIRVYPSPDNVDIIQYKDKAGNCFKFKETKVNCTSTAIETPVQI